MNIVKFENTKTLFFVSGMFAGGWMWQGVFEKMPNASNSLVMDDPLCKIGGSVKEISEQIVQELKKIDCPVTLVGNSLGSYVCLNVAALVPHKINKVIISGSAGFGEIALPIKLSPHKSYAIAQKLVNLICFDKSKATHQVICKTSDSFKLNFKNIIKLIRESNSLKVDQLLLDIQCPIHAIWGRDDIITPVSNAMDTFRRFDISLNIVSQCGHSPMFEKPDDFAALVNSYL